MEALKIVQNEIQKNFEKNSSVKTGRKKWCIGGAIVGVFGLICYLSVQFHLKNREELHQKLLDYSASGEIDKLKDSLTVEGQSNVVNFRGKEGKSLLMVAAERGNDEVVKLLLERGADIDLLSLGSKQLDVPKGKSALMFAVLGFLNNDPKPNTVRLLIEKGANVNLSDYYYKDFKYNALLLATFGQGNFMDTIKLFDEKRRKKTGNEMDDFDNEQIYLQAQKNLNSSREIILILRKNGATYPEGFSILGIK